MSVSIAASGCFKSMISCVLVSRTRLSVVEAKRRVEVEIDVESSCSDFIENNIESLVRLPFLELCFISHTTNVDIFSYKQCILIQVEKRLGTYRGRISASAFRQ